MPFIAWLAAAGFDAVRRRPTLRILAFSLVLASATIFVVGASTFPHWPDRLVNPLYDLVFPLLGRGYAVHSLGTAIGLRGLLAILPLYAFTLVAVLWLFGLLRRRAIPALIVVCALAAGIVASHRAFPMTDQKSINPWPMIQTIWEPRRRL
jgi:peptidoglycan/LPS O-acetylase OafA/YrhL